ncbi:MAG: SPOR domain-containing protein [Steroidobacteraceae bacterium]
MKERLTGAIILVALMVLLVPELLTGPPRTKAVGAPPAGTAVAAHPVHSYTLPLGPGARAAAQRLTVPATGSAARTAAAAAPKAAAPVPAARPVPASEIQTEAKPKVPSEVPPQVQHPATPSARPAAKAHRAAPVHRPVRTAPQRRPTRPAPVVNRRAHTGGHWTVQLGVFAVHADALRLAGRVRAKGFAVRLASLRLRGRLLWRVTGQAEPTRAAALRLARRLERAGVRGDLLRQ